MIKQERMYYTYIFEAEDRKALKVWLKENKLKLKDIHKRVNLSYVHLCRIVTGRRPASAKLVNKLKRMGVRI